VRVDIQTIPVAVLVELVNGWSSIARREDGRDTAPYPPTADIADRLGVAPGISAALDDQELVATADRLHLLFGAPDPASRAKRINDCLNDTGVRPTLREVRGTLHRGWSVPKPHAALLGAATITVREFLAEHGGDRLGVCAGQRCADVYVDTSRPGRRRFCSVTCQNRTRLAAHRRRQSKVNSNR
jgi:predicted RNA-binding Zn ribbon-like protein